MMKTVTLFIIMCFTQHLWAQRASYSSETNTSIQSVKLTESVSLQTFVVHLKLDSVQQKSVGRILSKQKLRPIKGEISASPRAITYERRRALFEKELKAVLTEKQYARFKAMQ
jgi:hypothetical protein